MRNNIEEISVTGEISIGDNFCQRILWNWSHEIREYGANVVTLFGNTIPGVDRVKVYQPIV